MARLQMTIDSLRVHPENFEKIVVLKVEGEEELYLPFAIGQAEFDALTIKMQGGTSLNPLTHDLFVSVINGLGANVNSMTLSDFQDGSFYAKLLLDVDRIQVELDCRPSDAMNIALSAEAPMFVEDEVLNKAGFRIKDGKPVPRITDKTKDDIWYLVTTSIEDYSARYNLRLS
jgi:bifunctional DNase/RNase